MAEFVRGAFAPDGPVVSPEELAEADVPPNTQVDTELEQLMRRPIPQVGTPISGADVFGTYNNFVAFCTESAVALDHIFKRHFPHTNLDFGGVSQALAAYCLDAMLRRK